MAMLLVINQIINVKSVGAIMSTESARLGKLKKIMITFCIITVIVALACLVILIFGDSYNRIRNFLASGSLNGAFTNPPSLKGVGFRPSEFGSYKLVWDDNFIADWLMSMGVRRYDIDVIEWVIVSLVIIFAFTLIICPYLIMRKTVDGKNPMEFNNVKKLYIVACVIAVIIVVALAPVILIK